MRSGPLGSAPVCESALTLVHGRESLRRERQEVAARVSEGYATAEAIKKR